jgi:DNA-binding winged helix-turn-helix (wHTH) protein/tetratricopeptide (TPR) repeat protein
MIHSPRHILRFQPFHIPSDVDILYRDKEVVPLEPSAVRVLRYLAENHERVVPKNELLEKVWPDVFTSDAVLKKAVSQARRALGDKPDDSRFIKTYHARGYGFVAPVTFSLEAETVAHEDAAIVDVAAVASLEKATGNPPDYDQMVGREAELVALQAEYGRTLEGLGQPLLITGEPGIGKTQLARYFMRWVREQGALCLYARFYDYEASRLAPYEVFLGLLRSAFGLVGAGEFTDETHAQDLRAMAHAVCGIRLPAELFAKAELLSGATSVRASAGGAGGDNFRAIVPISKCFTNLSRQSPVVIVLDDLQWADEASRDVVGYLMRTASSERLMLVILARNEEMFEAANPLSRWLKQQAHYKSFTGLKLNPLDEKHFRAAIEAVFGGSAASPAPPRADLQTLYQLTGGNPYFLTEMLRLLIVEDAISYDESPEPRWRWRGIKNMHLPDTLVLAAQAKLDYLSEDVRAIVEHAAVIGDEFRVEMLSCMSGRSEDEIETLLAEGVHQGVLSGRGVSSRGDDYRFHHTILRRVLYTELPPRRRKSLHARAVASLEQIYAREADRVAEALSAHAAAAGDWRKSFEWSLRAADAATARWQWNEAVPVINRAERAARELARHDGNPLSVSDRLKLLRAAGEVYYSVGRLKEAEAIWAEAIALSRQANEPNGLASALLQQGLTRTSLSLYQKANVSTEEALEIYHRAADREGEALALIQMSRGELGMGNYAASARFIEAALRLVGADERIAAIACGRLGWTRAFQGSYEESTTFFERAIGYHCGAGNVWAEAQMQQGLSWALIGKGQYERAIKLALGAREVFRNAGDAFGETKINMLIGRARIAQGLFEEGKEYLHRALESLTATGDAHCEAESLWMLGRACCEMGQLAEALTLLVRSLKMIRAIGDRDDEFRILTDIAHLKNNAEDYESALLAADEAIEIAVELDNRDMLGAALVERAVACLKLNQTSRALEEAKRAVLLLDETGSGERWRGYRTLGMLLGASVENKKARHKNDALAAHRRAVELLEEMREQLDPSDKSRRAGITHARSSIARELHTLLLQSGQADEAKVLAGRWMLDTSPTG